MAIVTAFTTGCATPPALYAFENAAVIDRPYDHVWAAISEYFTANNIQIKTIEKASGIIYAEQITTQPGRDGKFGDIGDCGDPGFDLPRQQSMQLNIFAKPLSLETTELTINVRMSEYRKVSVGSSYSVDCNSTGVLEQRLIALVSR